jgi:predicted Zn-dependent peptidase
MRKAAIILGLMTGVLMGANVQMIEAGGVEVPVIYERDLHLPIVSMQLVFLDSGSIEDKGVAGLARFGAKMLSEGDKDMGSAAFAQALEERAVSFSVSAGTETLVFELSSLKEDFEFGTQMLARVLKAPNFTKAAYDKVYAQTQGVILDKKSDFDYVANVGLRSLMYANSTFGEPSLGTLESIKSIDLERVEKFVESHLDLSNLIVVIGGDIEEEQMRSLIAPILKLLPKGVKRDLPHYDVSRARQTKITHEDSEQAYVYFGAPYDMKAGDQDAYKAKVAEFVLGSSGFGSRLMEEIRVKRGLAYSAYARYVSERSGSMFFGYLQTKNESQDEAVKIVREVIKEFVANGARADELEQAKRFLLGSEPLRTETLSQRLSRAFFEFYRGLGIGYQKNELRAISALTLDELNAFIKSHKEIEELMFSIVTSKLGADSQKR